MNTDLFSYFLIMEHSVGFFFVRFGSVLYRLTQDKCNSTFHIPCVIPYVSNNHIYRLNLNVFQDKKQPNKKTKKTKNP